MKGVGAHSHIGKDSAQSGRARDYYAIPIDACDSIGAHGPTEKRHQRLTLALVQGYYEISRQVDTVTIAGELGDSHQLLSEQFWHTHRINIKDAISIRAFALGEEDY